MTNRITVEADDYGLTWDSVPSYDTIVQTFGTIHAQAEQDDYQGDSLYLIKGIHEGMEQWGILTFGWGSCSGCDALQACYTQQDVNDLQDDLERGIRWFEDLDYAKEWLAEGGFKDSYLNAQLVLEFHGKVAEVQR